MRAWRSDLRARTASNLSGPRHLILLALLALLFSGFGPRPVEAALRAVAADSSESGFRVRVVEQSKGARAKRAAVPKPPDTPDLGDTLESPEPPIPPDFDESGENDLVRFGEDIEIPAGKVIEGNVVAMGGDVTVYGRVRGDVVSIGGGVEVRDGGAIDGDAVSVGGGVSTTDSASVGGSNVSIGAGRFGHGLGLLPAMGLFGAVGFGAWLFSTIVHLLLTVFFAWLALLLWRDGILRGAARLREQFGKSFLWGLLVMAGLVLAVPVGIVSLVLIDLIAVVILCITIIGIPLAILLLIALVLAIVALVVGVIFAIFLGYLNGMLYLGRRVLGARAETTRPIIAIAIGVALLAALTLAGKMAGFVGFILFHPLSIAFGIAAGALSFILTSAGLGALWITLFEGGGFSRRVRSYNWGPLRRSPAPGTAPAPTGPSDLGTAAPPPPVAPNVPPASPRPEGGSSDAP